MQQQKKVMLYALSTCAWCNKIKRFLKDNEIVYDYVDVDEPLTPKKKPSAAPPPAHQFGKVEAACVFCGQLTSDWWCLDRKTGRCKCRECLRQGIA